MRKLLCRLSLLGGLPRIPGQLWNDLGDDPRHLHRHRQPSPFLGNRLLKKQHAESKVLPVGPLSLHLGRHVWDNSPGGDRHLPPGGGG